MPGSMGFISKTFLRTGKRTLLIAMAVVIGLSFIRSWPKEFFLLQENGPKGISIKWFVSFPSPELIRDIYEAEDYNNRAAIEMKQGRLAQAITDYTKAIALEPGLAALYYNRGLGVAQEGNLALARIDFAKVIALKPEFVPAYGNLGIIEARQGQFTQAIALFTKALAIDPYYKPAYYNLDKLYYQVNNYPKAWAMVHKAQGLGITIEPEFIKRLKKGSGQDS